MTSDRLRLEMLDERRANERRRGVAGRQVMNERLDCKKEGKREREKGFAEQDSGRGTEPPN